MPVVGSLSGGGVLLRASNAHTHDWLGIATLGVGIVAAIAATWLVWALRHDRASGEFTGPASLVGLSRLIGSGRIHIEMPIHIVQGSSPFKVKTLTVTFRSAGANVAGLADLNDLHRGTGEFRGQLHYEMDDPGAPIEASAVLKFHGGGKMVLKPHIVRGTE